MTIGRARASLSLLWVFAGGPLLLLMVARSVTGFYGKESGELLEIWAWVATLLLPMLGLIVAAWSAGGAQGDDKPVRSTVVFWGAFLFSVFYLFTLYLVVALEPPAPDPWANVFRTSGWYLGFFQALVVAAIGKFFIENVH
jgi:hypothetical protein